MPTRTLVFIISLVLLAIAGLVLYQTKAYPASLFIGLAASKTTAATSTYTDPVYGFSFQYPSDYGVGSFEQPDEQGYVWHIVLIQSPDAKNGFQVAARPFDEEGPLTTDRLIADLPDMVISNAATTTVGSNIPALSLLAQDLGLDQTRQVWFLHEGYLYQIYSRPENEAVLNSVLQTWKFQ